MQRDLLLSVHAGLQATLHNAHFRTDPKQPVYTPAMFLDGYRPEGKAKPGPDWKRDLEEVKRGMSLLQPAKPEVVEAARQNVVMFGDRTKRAKDAIARGESREVIDRIMRGVA